MPVDSFKYLHRLITRYYKFTRVTPELPIPWTPLARPLDQCRFGLVTSAGLYHKDHELPFDVEWERREPTWGDPTFRTIPVYITQAEVGASHLHINTHDVLEDINILLPIRRFQELVAEGRIGSLAEEAYSFMGYQGFPASTTEWRRAYGPQVAEKLKEQEVDCVFVTNMPFWAQKIGVPRTLGVEFPFAHTLGQPHNREMQMRVICQALDVLEMANTPSIVVHSEEKWPASFEEAMHDSHPDELPPITRVMGRHIREAILGLMRGKN